MSTATLAPLPTGIDLRSVQETETRLLGALGRATEPVSLPELCRRAHLSIDLSRSVFSGLVKAGKVLIKQDKPPLYALPGQSKTGPRTYTVSRGHYQGTQLRATLMDSLKRLGDIGRDGAPIDHEQLKAQVQQANAMKGLADTLVDSARVEVDYIKATGADRSDFLEPQHTAPGLPNSSGEPSAHNPFPVSATHRLQG
jgi:hypothetical protein